MAVPADVLLAEVELLARCHADLPCHQVESGDQLGHRVLDLEAGVHLEEIELALLEEEFDRPGVVVATGLADLDGGLAHGSADVVREGRRRALLDQLLVASLRRAVPLAQPQRRPVHVAEHLHFDVARPCQVPLEVDLGPSEVGLRLPGRRLHGLRRLARRRDDLHAPATTAEGGLDGDGPAVFLPERHDLLWTGERF